MKTRVLATLLALLMATAVPLAVTGCGTAPAGRVTEVKTLKAAGATADTAMKLAAQLYHDGRITADKWNAIADFHTQKFRPAYNLAVAAVQSDLTPASPELWALAGQLAALVESARRGTP